MAVSSMVMMGAGTVTSAYGAYTSAKNTEAQMKYEAAMGKLNAAMAETDASLLDLNANISETQARMAVQIGQREEQQLRLRSAQLKGKQRVGFAASGVDLGVGSTARVLATTDYMTEVDAAEVRANAARQAFGYRVQSTNQKFAAMTARAQGAQYRQGSAFQTITASGVSPFGVASTSLLGGAGQVAQSWYMMQR